MNKRAVVPVMLILVVVAVVIAVISLSYALGFDIFGKHAKGGGESQDPPLYCESEIEGALIGANIKINEPICERRQLSSMIVEMFKQALIGGEKNLVCSASMDNLEFGSFEKLGNFEAWTEKTYIFSFDHVKSGQHNIEIRCVGKSQTYRKRFNIIVN